MNDETAYRTLLRLVHISDLHVGVINRKGVGAPPDATVRRWWGRFSKFSGLLGHSYIAMAQLEEFYSDQLEQGNTRLVVTGDLTTCGADEEFETARSFIESEAVLSRERTLGLYAVDALVGVIPGNHDHWPGVRTIVGDPTYRLWDTFPRRPLPPAVLDLDEHHRLVVFGINTDEDVHPTGSCRVWARGKFSTQLDALDQQITEFDSQDGDIRILLMHHSRMHSAYELGMTLTTRKRLDKTIESGRISVVLTGHVHSPAIKIDRIAGQHAMWDLLEARCGTTLQRDEVPPEWHDLIGDSVLEPNSLLLHEIVAVGTSRIEWHTTVYTRTARGFGEGPSLHGNRPVVIA